MQLCSLWWCRSHILHFYISFANVTTWDVHNNPVMPLTELWFGTTRCIRICDIVRTLNLLTPNIWLLILPSGSYTFTCKFVVRIWCVIKVIVHDEFVYSYCWIIYGYYREKLHVYHFWELMVNKLLWLHIISYNFCKVLGRKNWYSNVPFYAYTVQGLFFILQQKGHVTCSSYFFFRAGLHKEPF